MKSSRSAVPRRSRVSRISLLLGAALLAPAAVAGVGCGGGDDSSSPVSGDGGAADATTSDGAPVSDGGSRGTTDAASSDATDSDGGDGGDAAFSDPAPDYSSSSSWVCVPGNDAVCTTGLDAIVQQPDGGETTQTFTANLDPTIDCFYIYPTISKEKTPYADLADSPEIQDITRRQAGRLSSRCRVFAPIYRQATLAHLDSTLDGGAPVTEPWPYDDVLAAWNFYLANFNQGRGVVLVGHSQGTILLQDLIASRIDGKAAQAVLVSAFLAGDPSLAVPAGANVGGTFAHIPTCGAAGDVGCAYAWGTYLSTDPDTTPPAFGQALDGGMVSACEHPAAPDGGNGGLAWYRPRKGIDAGEPPFLEARGQVKGSCQTSQGAHIFDVTVLPTSFEAEDTALLTADEVAPGWGIHPSDIELAEGNILTVLDAEIAAWTAAHPALSPGR